MSLNLQFYQTLCYRLLKNSAWSSASDPEQERKIDVVSTPKAQHQSKLLSLPCELRLHIYKEVVGNSLIHCASRGGTTRVVTGFWTCPQPANCSCPYRIHGEGGKEPYILWHVAKKLPKALTGPSTSLLRTCQAMYGEATQLLYASNTFRIHDVWSVSDVRQSMPAPRYDQIRSLSIAFSFGRRDRVPGTYERTWGVPGAEASTVTMWGRAWDDLANNFEQIRELEIMLEVQSLNQLLEAGEEKWIQPMLAIRRLHLDKLRVRLSGIDGDFSDKVEEGKTLERHLEEVLMLEAEP